MNDYLLLKLSEMALRAIHPIVLHETEWVCMGEVEWGASRYALFFDQFPRDFNNGHVIFPVGTTALCLNNNAVFPIISIKLFKYVSL